MQPLNILKDSCHIWRVELDVTAAQSARVDVLDEAERKRAARLRFERDRERFATCRAALRMILGQYLRCEPAQLRFLIGKHGRPRLDANVPIEFNVAHSGDLALIAVAPRGPLGIDLEAVREIRNPRDLAARFFNAEECQAVEAATQPSLAFLTCWTRKEAILKSIGVGLTLEMRRIHVGALAQEQLLTLSVTEGGHAMRVQSFEPAQGYIGACALPHSLRPFEYPITIFSPKS